MKRATYILALLLIVAFAFAYPVAAAPINLSPGDIIVAGSCTSQFIRVDPVTGAQSVVLTSAYQPYGLTFAEDGDILFTTQSLDGGAIIRVDLATGTETVIASGGELARGQILGIAVAPDGQIIVAVPGGELPPAIVRVDPLTGAQTVLAEGYFNGQVSIFLAVAPDGTIYFTTSTGIPTASIWRITPDGELSLVSTGGLIQSTGGIAIASDGTLIVADYDSDAILRIDPATGEQSIISQGNLLQGQIGLALEADGDIVVADSGWQGGGPEVIRVDPLTGTQSLVTSGGSLGACFANLAVFPGGTQTEDADNDGVADAVDACPNSNLNSTVVIDSCNSGVPNTLSANGCTIADQVQQCAVSATDHGGFVSCVARLTHGLQSVQLITGQQSGAINSCAASSNLP